MFPESPGFARAANWATWGFFNFSGISSVLKAPFKAAQIGAKGALKTGEFFADYAKWLKDPAAYAISPGTSRPRSTSMCSSLLKHLFLLSNEIRWVAWIWRFAL